MTVLVVLGLIGAVCTVAYLCDLLLNAPPEDACEDPNCPWCTECPPRA